MIERHCPAGFDAKDEDKFDAGFKRESMGCDLKLQGRTWRSAAFTPLHSRRVEPTDFAYRLSGED
jgi:hypothetical protein